MNGLGFIIGMIFIIGLLRVVYAYTLYPAVEKGKIRMAEKEKVCHLSYELEIGNRLRLQKKKRALIRRNLLDRYIKANIVKH